MFVDFLHLTYIISWLSKNKFLLTECQNQCQSYNSNAFVIVQQYGIKYKNLPKNYFSSWSCILGSFKIKMANWEGSQLNVAVELSLIEDRKGPPACMNLITKYAPYLPTKIPLQGKYVKSTVVKMFKYSKTSWVIVISYLLTIFWSL